MAHSKWNEKIIQAAIWRRYGAKLPTMLPNYTPEGWFESDVWTVTKAGFAVEYEIKISKADFKNDFEKVAEYGVYRRHGGHGHKHQRLSLGDVRGPNRFFYVAPAGIIPLDAVPEYAGLIEVTGSPDWAHLKEIKKAPKLHKEQHSLDHRRVAISIYHRYWQLKERVARHGDVSEQTIQEIENSLSNTRRDDLISLLKSQAILIKQLQQQYDQLRGSTD